MYPGLDKKFVILFFVILLIGGVLAATASETVCDKSSGYGEEEYCQDKDGDGYDDCSIGEEGDDGKPIDCDDSESSPSICSEENACELRTADNCAKCKWREVENLCLDKDNDLYISGEPDKKCVGKVGTTQIKQNKLPDELKSDDPLVEFYQVSNYGGFILCSNSLGEDCDDNNPEKQVYFEGPNKCVSYKKLKNCKSLFEKKRIFYEMSQAEAKREEGDSIVFWAGCNIEDLPAYALMTEKQVLSYEQKYAKENSWVMTPEQALWRWTTVIASSEGLQNAEEIKNLDDFFGQWILEGKSFSSATFALLFGVISYAWPASFSELHAYAEKNHLKNLNVVGVQSIDSYQKIDQKISNLDQNLNERELTQKIYASIQEEIITDVPGGGRSIKNVLTQKKGVCQHKAALLSHFLTQNGIKNSIVSGPTTSISTHVWTRVYYKDGSVKDLEPTWYKSFIELPPRIVGDSQVLNMGEGDNVIGIGDEVSHEIYDNIIREDLDFYSKQINSLTGKVVFGEEEAPQVEDVYFEKFCGQNGFCVDFSENISIGAIDDESFEFYSFFKDNLYRTSIIYSEDLEFMDSNENCEYFNIDLLGEIKKVCTFEISYDSLEGEQKLHYAITGFKNLEDKNLIIFSIAVAEIDPLDFADFASRISFDPLATPTISSYEILNAENPPYLTDLLTEDCDGIDNNNNSLIDEGCDDDLDMLANSNMVCENEWYSEGNNVSVDINVSDSIVNIGKGWSLLSFPVENLTLDDLASCQAYVAFGYNSSTDEYVQVKEFEAGKGYWVYTYRDCEVDLSSYNFVSHIDIEMKNGWNLVSQFEHDYMNSIYRKVQGKIWGYENYRNVNFDNKQGSLFGGAWVYWDSENLIDCDFVEGEYPVSCESVCKGTFDKGSLGSCEGFSDCSSKGCEETGTFRHGFTGWNYCCCGGEIDE